MNVYAIGDLHLSGAVDKPMDIFGEAWAGHQVRMAERWDELVGDDDVVLIPGDISWAMTLTDALVDLGWLANRPGIKVITRGNHDYWWSGIGKVRAALPPRIFAVQNDSVSLDGVVVCGTRGWLIPGVPGFDEQDQRVYERELLRLRLSLDSARRSVANQARRREELPQEEPPIVVMLHYPPLIKEGCPSGFSDILEEYGVVLCVYGHLHGQGIPQGVNGTINGVEYRLVSSDSIEFRPNLVLSRV